MAAVGDVIFAVARVLRAGCGHVCGLFTRYLMTAGRDISAWTGPYHVMAPSTRKTTSRFSSCGPRTAGNGHRQASILRWRKAGDHARRRAPYWKGL